MTQKIDTHHLFLILKKSLAPLRNLLREHADKKYLRKYAPDDILAVLVAAATLRTSIKTTLKILSLRITEQKTNKNQPADPILKLIDKGLPPEWFISELLSKITTTEAENAVNRALKQQFYLAKRLGIIPEELYSAIDQHEIPVWSTPGRNLIVPINIKTKKYKYGHRYYVGALGNNGFWLAVAFIIERPPGHADHRDLGEICRFIVERIKTFTKKFKLRLNLADSKFFSKSVWGVFSELGVPSLCIAPKNSKVKKMVLHHHRKNHYNYAPGAYPYRLGENTFTLLIVPRPRYKREASKHNTEDDIVNNYVTLLTNTSPNGIINASFEFRSRCTKGLCGAIRSWIETKSERDYRERSNIEVLFRMGEAVRSRSNTIKPQIRVLLYGLTLILYNVYVIWRKLLEESTVSDVEGGEGKKRGVMV